MPFGYLVICEYAEIKVFKCVIMPGVGIIHRKQETISVNLMEVLYENFKKELNEGVLLSDIKYKNIVDNLKTV